MNRVITTSGITVIISPFRRKKKCSQGYWKYSDAEIENRKSLRTFPQHKPYWQTHWIRGTQSQAIQAKSDFWLCSLCNPFKNYALICIFKEEKKAGREAQEGSCCWTTISLFRILYRQTSLQTFWSQCYTRAIYLDHVRRTKKDLYAKLI